MRRVVSSANSTNTMGASKAMTRSLRWSPLAALIALGACTSVLGIEDLHEGPRPGVGGDENTAGTANTDAGKSNKGGAANNTTGGASNTSGGANAVGGSITPGAGSGNLPDGGVGNEAGAGGAATAVDGPVHGKVIDAWGAPLSSVPIQIGPDTTTTNAQGEFTFNNVPAHYEVSLTINGGNPNRDYGWVYQGLSRRDPTLQVYNARQAYEAPIVVKTTGVGTPGPTDTITAAFGTPSGETEDAEVDPTYAGGETVNVGWLGATSSTGTAHALLWSTASVSSPVPAKYKAYATKPMGFMAGVDDEVIFNLTPGTVDAGNISGTISGGLGDRVNKLFARFDSNAVIELMKLSSAPNTFSYLVPTLPKASITVAATAGSEYGPIGVAHADGLQQGESSTKLVIPVPATVKKPKIGAPLAANHVFSLTPGAGNDGPFVIFIERRDRSYFSMYIVTTQTDVALPSVLGGTFTLLPEVGEQGAEYAWGIETHGDYATVDDMAGPAGFIDSFGASWGSSPTGPTRQNGSFTYSGSYPFTLAP